MKYISIGAVNKPSIHMARHYSVVEVEVCIPQTRKVLMADP